MFDMSIVFKNYLIANTALSLDFVPSAIYNKIKTNTDLEVSL